MLGEKSSAMQVNGIASLVCATDVFARFNASNMDGSLSED
jgi:hypothetical protein